jgi:RNA polymerase sigma factor (TIGR02999 family)
MARPFCYRPVPVSGDITRLLRAYEGGDRDAFDQVVPLVYQELRGLARRHLRRGPRGYSLDTTGLVHEAYLKLAGHEGLRLHDRGHLMAVAARAMRQVLVDRARARLRQKRGAGRAPEPLEEAAAPDGLSPERLIDLDRALARLAEQDSDLVRVFECRYFGGLSEAETAEALGLPLRSAQRAWLHARVWLRAALEEAGGRP